jgi:hypothetical protein
MEKFGSNRAGACPKDERKNPPKTRRYEHKRRQNQDVSSSWDQSAGCLMTERAATGVEGA